MLHLHHTRPHLQSRRCLESRALALGLGHSCLAEHCQAKLSRGSWSEGSSRAVEYPDIKTFPLIRCAPKIFERAVNHRRVSSGWPEPVAVPQSGKQEEPWGPLRASLGRSPSVCEWQALALGFPSITGCPAPSSSTPLPVSLPCGQSFLTKTSPRILASWEFLCSSGQALPCYSTHLVKSGVQEQEQDLNRRGHEQRLAHIEGDESGPSTSVCPLLNSHKQGLAPRQERSAPQPSPALSQLH